MNEITPETDIVKEAQARRVLELTMNGDDEQASYTIEEACKKVGISRSKYWRLRKEGYVAAVKNSLAGQMSDMVHETLLPIQNKRYKLMARIAMGLPMRKGGSVPTIPEVLRANAQLDKIMPVMPIGDNDGAAKTPLQHIKDYQPKVINFNFINSTTEAKPDWLYDGSAGIPRFGEFDTSDIADADVRELTDDDIISPG